MIGKVPQTYANTRLYTHTIDGWEVVTILSPADLEAMGPGRAEAALRRVLVAGGLVRRAEQDGAA